MKVLNTEQRKTTKLRLFFLVLFSMIVIVTAGFSIQDAYENIGSIELENLKAEVESVELLFDEDKIIEQELTDSLQLVLDDCKIKHDISGDIDSCLIEMDELIQDLYKIKKEVIKKKSDNVKLSKRINEILKLESEE